MQTNSKVPTRNNTLLRSSRLLGYQWERLLLIESCLVATWSLLVWVMLSWEFVPDWVPGPSELAMESVACWANLIFCLFGLPTLLAFIVGLIINLVLLSDRILSQNLSGVFKLEVGLIILCVGGLPWFFSGRFRDATLNYGIARYDVVIDAIEAYHADYHRYPPSLETLVPTYLPEVPGIYMKFGSSLEYSLVPSGPWDHAPFTFELYGTCAGVHGQTLKYCPIEFEPCYEGGRKITPKRINERWIWVYSSAL